MSKICVACLYVLLWTNLIGASEQHVAVFKIDIDDIAPFVLQINENIGFWFDADVLADYARSLAVGNSCEDAIVVEY